MQNQKDEPTISIWFQYVTVLLLLFFLIKFKIFMTATYFEYLGHQHNTCVFIACNDGCIRGNNHNFQIYK